MFLDRTDNENKSHCVCLWNLIKGTTCHYSSTLQSFRSLDLCDVLVVPIEQGDPDFSILIFNIVPCNLG